MGCFVKNREGEGVENSGVAVVNLEKGKAVLVRNYMSDAEKERRAWGELGKG